MKKTNQIIKFLAPFALVASVHAADGLQETAILANLKSKYPNTVFKSVTPSKLPGIFEVVMGKNVAYVEETGRYFLFGHLFDMQTQTDLTESKIVADQVGKANFSELPIKDAIKIVRGKGTRKLAIFSDPDCPYCKKLEENISGLTDVTIYLFLFPIDQIHPQAKSKSIGVWCSSDPAKAWESLIFRDEVASGKCDNPIERNVALAEKLGINGTPTIILADGSVIPGAISAEKLQQLMKPSMKVADK